MMMYEGFAVSEKGYQHILNHTVCQDSTQYLQDADCVVATVADGHGSKQYFRSDRGSRFAAEIACNKIREFLKSITFPFPDSKTKKSVVTQLIHSIITEWHIAVRNDLIKSPFTPNELERVPEKYQKTFQFFTEENYRAHTESEISDLIQKEHSHVQKAYGTTLIAVGLCKSYAIGLHIGDGKCVALYEDGTMDEPIPWDENCHLNRCTSICDKNAASEFRCHIWDNQIPVAIFLGTDGIDDTFAEMLHSFYRNVALDFLHDNFRKRTEMLQANLANISKSGSHDDVSIAGILDVQKLSAIEQTLQQITKLETLTAQKKHLQDTIQELQFQLEKIQRLLSQSAETPETEEKIKRYLEKKRKIEEKLSEQQQKLAGVTRDIAAVQRGWEEKDDASGQVQAADTEEKTQDNAAICPTVSEDDRSQEITAQQDAQEAHIPACETETASAQPEEFSLDAAELDSAESDDAGEVNDAVPEEIISESENEWEEE